MNMDNSPVGRITGGFWTGSELLLWGGYRGGNVLGDGARYDPAANRWSALPASGLAARSVQPVWTGKELLVWGGAGKNYQPVSDGASFDPLTNQWTPIPSEGAPSPRDFHRQVWTGAELIVWGGQDKDLNDLTDGYSYNPETRTWKRLPDFTKLNELYEAYDAVWTGREMIVIGEKFVNGDFLKTLVAFRYDPYTGEWSDLPAEGAPSARTSEVVVWVAGAAPGTGELLIWGGKGDYGKALNDGYRLMIP